MGMNPIGLIKTLQKCYGLALNATSRSSWPSSVDLGQSALTCNLWILLWGAPMKYGYLYMLSAPISEGDSTGNGIGCYIGPCSVQVLDILLC